MTSDPPASTHTSVEALHVLKLLTRRQREQALAHPDLPQLAVGTPLPDTLMWLYRRQIVTSEDVSSLLLSLERHFTGDELALRLSILQQLVEVLNRESLDQLRDETLITQEQYQRALAHLPGDVLLPTPGEALNWMLHVELLQRAEFKSMVQRIASGGSDDAKRAIQHAQGRQDEHKKAVRGVILDGLFPGSRLTWVIVAPLALAGMVWYLVSGNSVPECDSSNTLATVTRMLNKAAPEGVGKASLHDVKEAGYASSHNIRGCLATIALDGEKMEYAYTVARDDSGGKSRISYVGAHAANAGPGALWHHRRWRLCPASQAPGTRGAGKGIPRRPGWCAHHAPATASVFADAIDGAHARNRRNRTAGAMQGNLAGRLFLPPADRTQ